MPYGRRRFTRRRRAATRRHVPTAATKRYVRAEIKRRAWSDISFVDAKFTGDAMSTTPDVYPIMQFINLELRIAANDWAARTGTNFGEYRQGKVKIESIRYQLRAQNDTTDLHSTVRLLMYDTSHTFHSNDQIPPIMGGADVDSPPDTFDVRRMYFDKMRFLKDQQGDEDSEVPGTAIMKGTVRCGRVYNVTFEGDPTTAAYECEDGTPVLEWQSNSSATPHPSMYGYLRIYFRTAE